jgi:hypothetical protein
MYRYRRRSAAEWSDLLSDQQPELCLVVKDGIKLNRVAKERWRLTEKGHGLRPPRGAGYSDVFLTELHEGQMRPMHEGAERAVARLLG